MKLLSLLFFLAAVLVTGCDSDPADEGVAVPEEVEVEVEEVIDNEQPLEIQEEVADISAEASTETAEELEEKLCALYFLNNETAGLFTIGASVSEVEELAAQYPDIQLEHIELMAEGMAYPSIQLTLDNNQTVTLELTDNTVSRIAVYSELFATDCRVGVGSTYDELVANYDIDGLTWGDGGDPIAIVEQAGMSFLIEPGDWWQMGEVQGDIPADTRVKAILIW